MSRVKPKDDAQPTLDELRDVHTALDHAVIVAVADASGRITYVNDKFCGISGYSREELIGRNHRIVNSGHHSPSFFADMWRSIAAGNVWKGEIRNRAKDGGFYWVSTTIVPFRDESGRIDRYISIRYPITERKEVEERLRLSNRELEEFASAAAHDLQEPLRKVKAFSERIRVRVGTKIDSETQGYFGRLQKSAERMQTLIDDLLSYARVSGKDQAFESVDLNAIVAGVLSDLEIRIDQAGATIDLGELPVLRADAVQMRQLFHNLLSNALKFQKPNEPPIVRVRYESGRIEIEDNGIGFDEKYADRIFTVFQRLHGRHEYEGTGIGLAICRKIAERHGGSISAASTLGKGSIFTVILGDSEGKERRSAGVLTRNSRASTVKRRNGTHEGG